MKRKILTLALCVAVSIFCAMAVGCSAENEPLTPTDESVFVINKSGVITDINATGKMLSTIVIPEKINDIEVKEIGQNAFKLCTNLVKIVLPEGLKTIRPYAFEKCTSLKQIVLPKSLTRIENYVFRNCSSLQSITMTDNVTYVGSNMFYNCTSLKSVKLSANITRIGKQMFYNCSSLKNIIIPKNVGQIEYNAFNGCVNLTSVTIEDGVDGIQYNAFSKCAISEITIPSSVTTIGNGAFSDCKNLKAVNIGSGLVSLGNGVFNICPKLEKFSLNEQNTALKIEQTALYSADGEMLFRYPSSTNETEYIVPSAVKKVAGGAFNGTTLKSIVLPSGVESIGDFAFSGAKNLTALVIPQTVTTLGGSVASDCPVVTVITDASEKPSAWTADFGVMRPVIYGYDGSFGTTENGLVWVKTTSGVAVALCDLTVTEVIIPEQIEGVSVTTLPEYAFFDSDKITKLVIPATVTAVSDYAIFICPNINIYCKALSQPNTWAEFWNESGSIPTFNYTE